jgi:hypothetical protein
VENVTDFLAIELQNGKLRMFVNFGSGTKILALEHKVRFMGRKPNVQNIFGFRAFCPSAWKKIFSKNLLN